MGIFFRNHKYLGSHDRKFVAETTYGMIRYKKKLEWHLAQLSFQSHSEQEHAMYLCSAYLLMFDAEYATILSADYSELLNEKKFQELRDATHMQPNEVNRVTALAVEYSFPEWLLEVWIKQFGEDETVQMCKSINTPAPITLRVNTLKTTVEQCEEYFRSEGIETERTHYSPFGLHVKKRMNVFVLRGFRAGFFEMQDEGSQLLPLLVDPKPRAKVVDACTGAGGKALELAALMGNRGEIFALDVHTKRLANMEKRIKRSGVSTIRSKVIDEHTLPEELVQCADYVLIDAPSSGIGTLRRNPAMKWRVTEKTVQEVSAKQHRIIAQYAECVKPNGTLVYATCTTMRAENEEVVERFLSEHPEFELVSPAKKLERYGLASLGEKKYFQLYPHIHGTDGFFAAVMKRKS